MRRAVLMARKAWDLTDAEWHAIEAVLPSRGGRPRINDRLIITGLLHSLATGAPFAELERYANPSTLETRFRRWDRDGTLQGIMDAIGFRPMAPTSAGSVRASGPISASTCAKGGADMADGASSAAARPRRARQRRRLGRVVFRVELDKGEIIQALISSGILSEVQAPRPRSMERELAEVLSAWARRWAA